MNKKVLKTLSILVLALALVFTFVAPAFAVDTYLDTKYIKAEDSSGAAAAVQSIAGSVLAVAQIVAISVAVIMLIILAIKYISAAPNDKAEIKKHAIVYVVGALVLFSASGILEVIKRFAININSNVGDQTEIQDFSQQ